MQTRAIHRIGLALTLLAMASLLISAPALALSRSESPARRPAAALITIDLCAQPGSLTMPDSTSITIWGFALDDGSCGNPATLPGYPIVVNEGDVVTVNLTNNLPEDVSIIFPGQDLFPDTQGAASGGNASYTFTASSPGTYLYESGTNTGIQLPMGLYGALIVRPALGANFAYNDAATEFDVEAVLVLSELDADLNNLGDPNTFNLLNYGPDYWLINGEAYPDTDTVLVDAGDRVLLRYLNPASFHHTMQLLGMHQRVVAKDAYPLLNPFSVIVETMPSGQTADMIVNIPGTATTGTRYALYNRQLRLTNASARPGGMLTFIEVVGGGVPPSPTPTPTNTPTPTPTNTPTPTPIPSAILHLSLDTDGTVGSLSFADEDILSFDGTSFSLLFDGSDVGVGGLDLDAFYVVDADTILMSFSASGTIGSLGTVDDSDVVQFDATTLGAATAGTFSWFFDGSDVGLGDGILLEEDVDAIERLSDGSFIISTNSAVTVPSLLQASEDLLRCVGTFGSTTTCTWSVYFDGSDVALSGLFGENVDAMSRAANGDIYLSTESAFSVTGVSGADEDVFICGSPTTGSATACTYSPTLFFDGSAFGLGGNDVDAIDLP